MEDAPTTINAAATLLKVATAQEATLEGLNIFQPGSNEYSATNKAALSEVGKGDSNGNVGDGEDIKDRSKLLGINTFNASNPYKTPA